MTRPRRNHVAPARALAAACPLAAVCLFAGMAETFAQSEPAGTEQPARAPGEAATDSTYEFVHPDSLDLYRTYDRRYIREDTLEVPFTYIYKHEIETIADRLTLAEILKRCIASEKHQFDDVEDISYRLTEKAVFFFGDPKAPLTKRSIHEEISRVYRKQPDHMRVAALSSREYTLEAKDGVLVKTDEKDHVEIDVSSTREELTNLPFFFEDLDDYDFGIEERVDLEDRVLYRISFAPRSDFDALPTGEFWIDTTDFRIFHTDLRFTDNVPLPLILKAVEHASIEMRRVNDLWVYDRVSARVLLRKLPFVPLPVVVDVVVVFDDYAIDRGLSLDVFGEEG